MVAVAASRSPDGPPRAAAPSPWPRRLRQLHLYLGALFAPAILFFAFSGALQEFDLHEPWPGSDYRPAVWIVRLAAVHKHQTLALPPQKHAHAAKAKPAAGANAPPERPAPPPTPPQIIVLRIFFALTAAGLIGSTLIGLYLAFRFTRRPRVVLALIVVGVLAPLALLAV
ncbi:MAG: hypothetical protein P4L73_07310 [Caulobacteraceae bacterium]|nr:hypothetical protein [Caulobacteraceae bacterium]